MTPISEMTNDELDRYIAEKKGWKYWDEYQCWLNPTHRELGIIYELPSYTTDPRYAIELLEELPTDAKMRLAIFMTKEEYYRAISEAYAQWKGEK